MEIEVPILAIQFGRICMFGLTFQSLFTQIVKNLDNRASKHMFDYKDRIVELQDKIKANVSFSTLFDFAHKLMKVV